jgi:hypothetical protein
MRGFRTGKSSIFKDGELGQFLKLNPITSTQQLQGRKIPGHAISEGCLNSKLQILGAINHGSRPTPPKPL